MSDGENVGGGAGHGTGGAGAVGGVDPLTGQPIVADPAAGAEGGTGLADDGGADPDWYQNISAESGEDGSPALRDWLKSSGIKDMDGLAKVARDNQKALRESGRIKIPGEGASDTEVAEFRKALGVPDDPSGYAVPEFKDADGAPVELDTDMLTGIFASAHKHGGSKAVIEGVVTDFIEMQRADIDRTMVKLQEETDAVVAGWGKDKPEKMAQGHRAINALGLTAEEVQGLKVSWGPERALTVLATLGAGLSEDSLLTGGGVQRFGVSGAQAQAALNSKRADPVWVAKAVQPGTPENAEHDRYVAAIAAEAARHQKAA